MDPIRLAASPRTLDKHTKAGLGYYASLAARTWIKLPRVDLLNPLFPQPRALSTVVGIPCDPIGVVSPTYMIYPGLYFTHIAYVTFFD